MTLTSEQIAARSGAHIGGSDFPEILGLRGSALELYMVKRGEMDPTRDMRRRFQVGHAMEPLVRTWFEEDTGKRVIPPEECGPYLERLGCVVDDSGTLHHPEHEWMVGHLDGLVEEPDGTVVPFEAKSAETFMGGEWGESGTDEVPRVVVVQVEPYIAMTRAPYSYVSVTVGMSGRDTRWFQVARSDELIDFLIAKGSEFVRRVVEGDPPDPASVSDAKLRWPFHVPGLFAEASDEVMAALRKRQEWKTEAKRIEKELGDVELIAQKAIGDREGLERKGRSVCTWKRQRRAGYSVGPAEFRVLRVNKKNLNV